MKLQTKEFYMNKTKVLTMLACMGLLLTACGGKPVTPSSEQPSSENPSVEPSSQQDHSLVAIHKVHPQCILVLHITIKRN